MFNVIERRERERKIKWKEIEWTGKVRLFNVQWFASDKTVTRSKLNWSVSCYALSIQSFATDSEEKITPNETFNLTRFVQALTQTPSPEIISYKYSVVLCDHAFYFTCFVIFSPVIQSVPTNLPLAWILSNIRSDNIDHFKARVKKNNTQVATILFSWVTSSVYLHIIWVEMCWNLHRAALLIPIRVEYIPKFYFFRWPMLSFQFRMEFIGFVQTTRASTKERNAKKENHKANKKRK